MIHCSKNCSTPVMWGCTTDLATLPRTHPWRFVLLFLKPYPFLNIYSSRTTIGPYFISRALWNASQCDNQSERRRRDLSEYGLENEGNRTLESYKRFRLGGFVSAACLDCGAAQLHSYSHCCMRSSRLNRPPHTVSVSTFK